jgi:phosphatidate cytidylyltransferase
MLIQRIVTAIVLLAALLPALFFGVPNLFNAMALILIAAAVWEWSRMNGYSNTTSVFFGLDALVICVGLMYLGITRTPLPLLWLCVTAFWVLTSAYLLKNGVAIWDAIPKALRLIGGVFILCATWLAVAQLREVGINLLLSAFLLVWAADIFAYAAGRLFGRHKLAPSVSPGKTWEGVFGGFVGVLMMAGLWLWVDYNYASDSLSLYSIMLHRFGYLSILVLVFLTMMAVVGDLIESLVKRSAGVKDSSGLLPGHGGVLDRVDALLPVLPVAMLLVSFG